MAKPIQPPKANVPTEVKESKAWCLNASKYIHQQYVTNNTLCGASLVEKMRENRAFGAGRESSDRYKKALGKSGAGAEREIEQKIFQNVNYENMSVLPKFRHIVVNKFMAEDHRVEIDAIDKDATQNKKIKKWLVKVEKDLAAIPSISAAQGITPVKSKDDDEKELLEKIGGFKLAGEIVHKKMSIYNFQQSDWPEIKRSMLGDAFDVNMMACKDYLDPSSGRVKVRYVDVLNAGASHNRAKGYNASEFFYERTEHTISELRIKPDLSYISNDEWERIAKAHSGYGSNASLIAKYDSEYDYSDESGMLYDSVAIPCLDWEYITIDKDHYTIRNKGGKEHIYKEKKQKIYKTDKRTTKVDTYKNAYKGLWLIDTEHVTDYGQQNDIPRPIESDCKPSWHFYKIAGPSMVELAKESVVTAKLAQIRLEGLIASAPNPGIAIEYGALSNIKLGNEDAKPLDLFRLRVSSGNLVYTQSTKAGVFGQRGVGGSGLPFKELAGGMGPFAQELLGVIASKVDNIRSLTGINEVVDGSSPNADTTARQAMLAADSSNNALGSIYAAYKWIKKETAENMALRTQLTILANEKSYNAYFPIADSSGMEYIEMTKEHTFSQLGITVSLLPTQSDIAEYKRIAESAVATGALDVVEAQMLIEFAKEGRTEEALLFISYRTKKKQDAEAAKSQQAIKLQGEQQTNLEEYKANAAMEMDKRSIEMKKQESKIAVELEKQLSQIRIAEEKAKKTNELMLEKVHGKDVG